MNEFWAFLRICQWKATRSVVRPGVCSMSLARTPQSYAGRWWSLYLAQLVSRCSPTAAATCRRRTRGEYRHQPDRTARPCIMYTVYMSFSVYIFCTILRHICRRQQRKFLINEKLELDTQCQALYASAPWALGHAVTLTFDLLTPKLEQFTTVIKCTNVDSLVKISPIFFKILC